MSKIFGNEDFFQGIYQNCFFLYTLTQSIPPRQPTMQRCSSWPIRSTMSGCAATTRASAFVLLLRWQRMRHRPRLGWMIAERPLLLRRRWKLLGPLLLRRGRREEKTTRKFPVVVHRRAMTTAFSMGRRRARSSSR